MSCEWMHSIIYIYIYKKTLLLLLWRILCDSFVFFVLFFYKSSTSEMFSHLTNPILRSSLKRVPLWGPSRSRVCVCVKCVWSVCEVSGSRRPGTGVWQWFVKRDNTAHWPAGSTVCCTYLAQPSHEDPPLFKQDTRLPQAQGGVNECVLCEMERHNGRLVALTMRFHTIRGWQGD